MRRNIAKTPSGGIEMPVAVTWDHVHLRSPDPEATAAWLRDILGGEIVRAPGRIDVNLGGAKIFIAPLEGDNAVNPPPTHILNGFMWALWGVFDYWLATSNASTKTIFNRGVETLLHNLDRFDTGYWSLYEQSGTHLKMLASPFYHRLHIVQLRVMSELTGDARFAEVAERWEGYAQRGSNRTRALIEKSVFKLLHY